MEESVESLLDPCLPQVLTRSRPQYSIPHIKSLSSYCLSRQVAELSEEAKLLFYMKLPSEFEDSTNEREKDPPSSMSRRSKAAVSWLQNKCEEEKNASVQKQDLYDRYIEDCEDAGQLHVSSTHFGKIVKIVFPSVHHRRLGQRGQSKYSYYGLKLKGDNYQMSLRDAFNSYKDIEAFHPSLDSSEVYPVSCQLVCEWASQLLDKPFPDIKSLSEYLISIGFSCGKTAAKFHLLSGGTSPPKMAADKKNLSSRLVQRRLQHNEIIRQHKEKLKQQLQRQREQREANIQEAKTMRIPEHPSKQLSKANKDVDIVQRPMSVQPFTSPTSGITTSKSIWYMPVPTSVEQHSVECSALLASLTKRCHSTSVVEKHSDTPGTLYNGNMSSNSQHFFQKLKDGINKSKSGVESSIQNEPVLGQDSMSRSPSLSPPTTICGAARNISRLLESPAPMTLLDTAIPQHHKRIGDKLNNEEENKVKKRCTTSIGLLEQRSSELASKSIDGEFTIIRPFSCPVGQPESPNTQICSEELKEFKPKGENKNKDLGQPQETSKEKRASEIMSGQGSSYHFVQKPLVVSRPEPTVLNTEKVIVTSSGHSTGKPEQKSNYNILNSLLTNDDPPAFGNLPAAKSVTPALSRSLLISQVPHLWRTPSSSHICDNTGVRSAFVPVTSQKQLTRALSTEELGCSKQQSLPNAGSLRSLCDKEKENNYSLGNSKKLDKIQVDSQKKANCSEPRDVSESYVSQTSSSSSSSSSTSTLCQSGDSVLCGSSLTTPTPATSIPFDGTGGSASAPATLSKASALVLVSSQPTVSSSIATSPSTVPPKKPGKNRFTPIRPKLENCFTVAPQKLPQSPLKKDMRPVHTLLQEQRVKTAQELLASLANSHQSEVAIDPKGVIVSTTLSNSSVTIPGAPLTHIFQTGSTNMNPGLTQPQILLSLPKGKSNPPLIILPGSSQTQPQCKPIVLQDAKGNKYTLEEEPTGAVLLQTDKDKPSEETKDANVKSGPTSLQVQVVGPDVRGQSYLLVPNSEAGAGVTNVRSKSVVQSESPSLCRQDSLNRRSVSMMLSPTSSTSSSVSTDAGISKGVASDVCRVKAVDIQLLKETDKKCGSQSQRKNLTLDKTASKNILPASTTSSAFHKCLPESGLVQRLCSNNVVDTGVHQSSGDSGNPIHSNIEVAKVPNLQSISMTESKTYVSNKEEGLVNQAPANITESRDLTGNSHNGFTSEGSNMTPKVPPVFQGVSFEVHDFSDSKSEVKNTENSHLETSLQHALRKRKATSTDVGHGRKKRNGDSDTVKSIEDDDLQILEPCSMQTVSKGDGEKMCTSSVEKRPTAAITTEEYKVSSKTDTETLLNMLGDTKSMTVKQVVAALNKVRKQLDLVDKQGSSSSNMEAHQVMRAEVGGHSKKVKRSRTRAVSSPVTRGGVSNDSALSTGHSTRKQHQRPSGRSASLNLESLEIDALLDLDPGVDTQLVDDIQDKEKTDDRDVVSSGFTASLIASRSRPESAVTLSSSSGQEKRPSSVSAMVCAADQVGHSLHGKESFSQPFVKFTAERSRSCVQDILKRSVSCKRQDVARHSSVVIGHLSKPTNRKNSEGSSNVSHLLRSPKPLKATHQRESLGSSEGDQPTQALTSYDSDMPIEVIDFITESMAGKSRPFVENPFSSLLENLGGDSTTTDNNASGTSSSFTEVNRNPNIWSATNTSDLKERELDISNPKGVSSSTSGGNTLSSGTFLSPTGPARPVRRASVERSLSTDRLTPKLGGEQTRPPSRLKLMADNPSELRCPTPVDQVVSIKQTKHAKRDSYIAKDQTTAIMLQQSVDHSKSALLDLPETCISGFVVHGTAESLRGDRALSETPVSDPGYSSVGQTPVSEVGGSVSASPAAMLMDDLPSSTFVPVRAASVTAQTITNEELNQSQMIESSMMRQGSQKETNQSMRTNNRMYVQGSDLSDKSKENPRRMLSSGHTHNDLIGFDKLLSVKLECMPTPPSSPTSLPNLQRDALKSPMAMNSSCKTNSTGSYCMAPPRPPSSACVQPRLSVTSTSPMITNQIDVTNLGNLSRYSPRPSSSPHHHQHQHYPHPSPPFTPVAVSMVSPRCGTPCGDLSAPNRFMPIQTSGILATSLATSHFPLYIQPIKPVVTLASAASVGLTHSNHPATLPANTLPIEVSPNIVDRPFNLAGNSPNQSNTFQVSCPTLSKKTTSKKLAALGDTLPKSAVLKSSVGKTAVQNMPNQPIVILSIGDRTGSEPSLAPNTLKLSQRSGWPADNLPTYQEAVSQIGIADINMDPCYTAAGKISTNKEQITVRQASENMAVQQHVSKPLPECDKLKQIVSLDLEPQPNLSLFHCDPAKRRGNLGGLAAPAIPETVGVSAPLVDTSEMLNQSTATEQFDHLAETLDVLKTLDSHYFQHDEDSNLGN